MQPVTTRPPLTDISQLQRSVLALFALVAEGIAAATESFLAGDRETARRIVAGDPLIDERTAAIEELVQQELDRPVEEWRDVRLLVSVLRVVPELERSGDLVEHIALRTPSGLGRALSPAARGAVGEMGRLGASMWRLAAEAWRLRDPAMADRLRLMDDRIDDLHVTLTDEVARSAIGTAAAIEMGLVARFFERLGDHAVNVARRIAYLAAESPVTRGAPCP